MFNSETGWRLEILFKLEQIIEGIVLHLLVTGEAEVAQQVVV